MPFLGEIVELSNQLWNGDPTKFVRAVVRDAAGDELTGSPFALTHVGNGKYTNNSLAMPNENRIDVTYETYDDAGFTTLSSEQTISTDVFRLEIPDTTILAKLDSILNIVSTFNIPGSAIRVNVGIDNITAKTGEAAAIAAAFKQAGIDAEVVEQTSVGAKTGIVSKKASVEEC